MTTTQLDPAVARDLAALGADSRKDLPSLDESLAMADGGVYRDGRAGVEAKRDSLLAGRRLELALMPLATGRIFVHRLSRAAAGATAAVAAMFVVILVADPTLMRLASFFVPGLNISVVLVATVAAILGAYVVAGFVGERIFEGRMRAVLESRGDAFDDIDALAHGPVDEAKRLARKLDGFSTALPLLGFAACAPLFAFLSLVLNAGFSRGFYGPSAVLSEAVVSSNLSFILLAIFVGAVLALFVGLACARERGLVKPLILRVLGHWATIPLALVFGMVVLSILGSGVSSMSRGHLPGPELRAFVAVGGTIALLVPVSWLALVLRRVEQRRLERTSGDAV